MQSPVKLWRNQTKLASFFGREGKVLTWSVIRVPPLGFESQAPYVVALVSFGKERRVGQLVDIEPSAIHKDLRVKATIRRVTKPDPEGIIPYGIKFVPLS